MTSPALEVVLLGTGSPLPSAVRCGAGQVIFAGDTRVMVDCGWGASRRLFQAGIPLLSIDAACFTHMHSDHITDFADFLIMRWVSGAKRPLAVFGPEGTAETVAGFLAALRRDIGYRQAHHGDKLSADGIVVNVHEVAATPAPTEVARLGDLLIESFEVDHFPAVPAFGYRFTRQGRRMVLSGDTTVCANLKHACEDADLVVCEAVNTTMLNAQIEFVRGMNPATAALMEDIQEYHAPTLEVAAMARDARVKQLALSHIIPPVADDGSATAAFLQGMSDVYTGPIALARDLQRFAI